MKKRYPCLLLAALLCLSSGFAAKAADAVPYTLDGAGVSLEIPSDLTVFTRDTDENDPVLAKYGLTKEELLSTMESDKTYLMATEKSGSYSLIVTSDNASSTDIDLMDETALEALRDSLDATYDSGGLDLTGSEICLTDSGKYLKIHFSSGSTGSDFKAVQYYTVSGRRALSITLYSYTGAVTSGQEAVIKAVVDSVVFTAPPAGTSPSSNTFTDSEGGVSFTVPAGWSEIYSKGAKDFYGVSFSPDSDPSVTAAYLRADIWGPMSAFEKAGRTRAEINSSTVTADDITGFLDMTPLEADISRTEVGGLSYFKILTETDGNQPDRDITIDVTRFVYVENGYMYVFQFGSVGESEYYPDFEALLESVSYPAPAASSAVSAPASSSAVSGGQTYVPASETSAASGGGASWLADFGDVVLALIVTMVVFSLPVVIYRHGIRKRPVPRLAGLAITAVYGLICLLLVYLIFGSSGVGFFGGVLGFWSLVNYFVLTGGKAVPGADGRGAGLTGGGSSAPDDDTPEPEAAPEFSLCPHCGSAVKPGSITCLTCGEKIFSCGAAAWKQASEKKEPAEEAPPEADAEPEAGVPFLRCPSCGSTLYPGDIFCSACGARISKKEPPPGAYWR